MNKKRNGFYYRDDKEYPSTTKILGEVLAKPALLYWYGREATRIALKNPELNEKEVMAELQLKVKTSADRGHKVHEFIQAFSSAKEPTDDIKPYIEAFWSWWKTHSPQVIYQEIECFSELYNYACRLDWVGRINDRVWIIDFKTSADGTLYQEVGLQLASNRQALLEEKGISVDAIGAVGLASTGEFVFKEMNDTIEDFLNVKRVWEWMKRKKSL